MIPGYTGGPCNQWDLGTVDMQICDDMYEHGAFNANEPGDDLWAGANALGTIDGSISGEEVEEEAGVESERALGKTPR